MSPVPVDVNLVSHCGLYCGACKKHLSGRCPGCHENHKASWCTVRSCCMDKHIATCAECKEFADPMGCGKFNNVFSKVIGLVLNSSRAACIAQVKERGLPGYAAHMASQGLQTLPRRARR